MHRCSIEKFAHIFTLSLGYLPGDRGLDYISVIVGSTANGSRSTHWLKGYIGPLKVAIDVEDMAYRLEMREELPPTGRCHIPRHACARRPSPSGTVLHCAQADAPVLAECPAVSVGLDAVVYA